MMTRSRRFFPRAPVPALLSIVVLSGCGRAPEAAARNGVEGEAARLRARTLADAVADARPGDTIVLPAGTFEAGITLPPRVGLRGAGYRKTILDARKAEVGLTVVGGMGIEIADLTVWGASRTDVLVSGASKVALRRLRTTGGLNGVNFADVDGGRIENVLSDDNRYGIVVSGGRGNAVVNCTAARNSGLGLSLPSGEGTVAFNNCFADGVTGVSLGKSARGTVLDYNLYFVSFVGRMSGQTGRKTLGDWQSVSGQDAHSVQLPLTFRDPGRGDDRPTGTLPWSLERAATTDWGVESLSGVTAPEADIDGHARTDRHDVGAFEVAPPSPARPPDGTLAVRSDAGIKSAGVFAPDGREVARLFHDLPLPEGLYPFWLPSRDVDGGPIPAGTYELRMVERPVPSPSRGRRGDEAIATHATAFTLAESAARLLDELPPPPAPSPTRPAPPTILVPRLSAPWPIDGDPGKWRKAGIDPQIVATPETAAGAIAGPKDLSAVVRLAHDGDALYLQVLTFDDAPTPRHDGVALCINGSVFDINRDGDSTSVVLRRPNPPGDAEVSIPPDRAPRVVKVLRVARDIPERRWIESIYGVDLADSPTIVGEFKLPMETAKGLFALKPGRALRLGILINDGDDPGAGVQGYLTWPATFGPSSTIDDAGLAVPE